ncbi:MAG: CapA family protein [Microvirga sp.]|nr:CapA family protein [Microvirga sp.]
MSDLTLLATGDIFLGSDDSAAFLEPIAPMIREADVAIGNLEAPASALGEPSAEKRAYGSKHILRMKPEVVGLLRDSGFHAMSVANNHGMDFGGEALLDTLARCDAAGIARAGGGRDIDEARAHAIVERDGVRIALVSMTFIYAPVSSPAREDSPGLFCVGVDTAYAMPRNLLLAPGVWPRAVTTTRVADRAAVLESIARAKADADIVVAACHWGLSGFASGSGMGVPAKLGPNFLTDYQRDMGRAIVEAGADLVVGHHPHRLQGVEFHRGKLIAYSLGNFLFSFELDFFTHTGGVLKLGIDRTTKEIVSHAMLPVVMDREGYRTRPARGAEIGAVRDELAALSEEFAVEATVSGEEIVLRG